MNVQKRGPGRPKKMLPNDVQFGSGDYNKKVKVEDGVPYLPQQEQDDFIEGNMDAMSNSNPGEAGDYDGFDDFQPRGWNSSMKDKTKGRHDNSLSVLTRKFIHLIRNSPNFTVDLNDAVRELNVQKRRIYDITNVLEGIGYIQKVLKNKIKWVGSTDSFNDENDVKLLSQELEALVMEEREISKWSNTLQEMLTDLAKDEINNEYSFVTFDDIKAVNTVAKEGDQPFLVIRAPKGTLLEVPNVEPEGEDEHPYKMKLTSQHEEIFIYVVSNDGQSGQQEVQKQLY